MIEALGVPHTEVELILVNGESADFGRLLWDGDRVAVYPRFEAFDITPLLRLRERPLRVTRFVADVASREGRIVLTRDRELLKLRRITHGCYIHALKPAQQFRELLDRLDLTRSLRPFTLCMECNAPLRAIDKAQVLDRLPPAVLANHQRFTTGDLCGRIFWEGTQWQRLRALIDDAVAASDNSGRETARHYCQAKGNGDGGCGAGKEP